jgi:Protein of unknown function (DUF2934)
MPDWDQGSDQVRACLLWEEQEGRPEGQAEEHWAEGGGGGCQEGRRAHSRVNPTGACSPALDDAVRRCLRAGEDCSLSFVHQMRANFPGPGRPAIALRAVAAATQHRAPDRQ